MRRKIQEYIDKCSKQMEELGVVLTQTAESVLLDTSVDFDKIANYGAPKIINTAEAVKFSSYGEGLDIEADLKPPTYREELDARVEAVKKLIPPNIHSLAQDFSSEDLGVILERHHQSMQVDVIAHRHLVVLQSDAHRAHWLKQDHLCPDEECPVCVGDKKKK